MYKKCEKLFKITNYVMNYNLKISKFQHISGMFDREGRFAKNYEIIIKKDLSDFLLQYTVNKTSISGFAFSWPMLSFGI